MGLRRKKSLTAMTFNLFWCEYIFRINSLPLTLMEIKIKLEKMLKTFNAQLRRFLNLPVLVPLSFRPAFVSDQCHINLWFYFLYLNRGLTHWLFSIHDINILIIKFSKQAYLLIIFIFFFLLEMWLINMTKFKASD